MCISNSRSLARSLTQDEVEFRDKNAPPPVATTTDTTDMLPPEGKSCCRLM